MNKGIVLSRSDIEQQQNSRTGSALTIRIECVSDWKTAVPLGTETLIHAADGASGSRIAYSASGTVTDAAYGLRGVWKGSRVAVFGVADCPPDAEFIITDEKCVRVTDADMETAALAGIGACYVNLVKSLKMPLCSRVRVDSSRLPLLGQFISTMGYSDAGAPDYTVTDAVIDELGGVSPGADWADESVGAGKQIYPYAYVSNTTAANAAEFLAAASSGKLDAAAMIKQFNVTRIFGEQDAQDKEYSAQELSDAGFVVIDAAKHVPGSVSSDEKTAVIFSNAADRLGDCAGDFMGRKAPAIVIRVCPAGENAAQTMFEKLAEACEWIACAPTCVSKVSDCVVIAGFEDGSHVTVHLVPGSLPEHAELHWGGKSIIIDGDAAEGYGCAKKPAPPEAKLTASCLKKRAELFASLL